MRKSLLLVILGITLCLGLVGCGKTHVNTISSQETTTEKPLSEKPKSNEKVDESVEPKNSAIISNVEQETNNDYTNKSNMDNSIYLADFLYENTQDNIIFSPTSLNMALCMASEGATRNTKEKLDSYLSETDYRTIAKSLRDRYYRKPGKNSDELDKTREEIDSGFALNIENSAWVSQSRKIVPLFERAIADNYQAELFDFDNLSPMISAERINKWGEEKTNGLIKQIIEPKHITEDTSLILLNTVYFKDTWGSGPWLDYNGDDNEFIDLNGTKTTGNLITNTVDSYFENDYAEAFRAHYSMGLSFYGILPKEDGEFNLADLDIAGLLQSDKTTEYTSIEAIMPEFKFSTSNNCLKAGLTNLGLGEMFTSAAHFENIVETGPGEYTYVDDILQRCTIDLDKYGTEAAAETAVLLLTKCSMLEPEEPIIKEVRLNRPFAFVIMDDETNQIIFMGKVVNLG